MPNQAWYDIQENPRMIIAKVGVYSTGLYESAGEKTKYLTNKGYNTVDGNTTFYPFISGSVRTTETLNPEGGISMSYGDIEIINTSGDLDNWLDSDGYVWVNRPVEIYYGSPTTIITSSADIPTNFDLIFSGVIADIDSRSVNTLNIKIRDSLERLNMPITEDVLGTYGTWAAGQSNQDTIKPLVFGEPHNIPVLLIDPSQIEFLVAVGPIEQITQIRDNGVPIYIKGTLEDQATINLSTGKFKLNKPLVGECTASIQGLKNSIDFTTGSLTNNYSNTIAQIIAILVTQYGNSSTRFSISEIDLTNFLAFNTANAQPVGLLINSRENLLSTCQSLASSLGAQIYVTRVGKLQILRYGEPTSDPVVEINTSNTLINSLSISGRSVVSAAKKIAYAKNWNVQSNLITAIPQEHKYMYATEYWYKTSVDSTGIKTLYKLNAEPVEKRTLLINGTDAEVEANRLNNYFGQTHTRYKVVGSSKLLTLKLGQQVFLKYNRYGLSSGKYGQIVSLSPDWIGGKVDIEVVV